MSCVCKLVIGHQGVVEEDVEEVGDQDFIEEWLMERNIDEVNEIFL